MIRRSLNIICISIFLFSFDLLAQVEHSHDFELIQKDLEQGIISLEESVLFKFRAVFNPENLAQKYRDDELTLKCLTPTIAEFEKMRASMSSSFVSEIDTYLSATQSSLATYVTPSGKFMIEYSTSGSNAVPLTDANTNGIPDYVEEAGIAADSSYRHEILSLGNSDPIPDGQMYSITLADIGPYGFTQRIFTGDIATRIVVENDFVGFPSNDDPDGDQLGALRVTIAHELKHAIQYIDNQWTGETDRWLEMDATLMEEVVYDQVNDYYNYIYDTRFGDPIFLRPTRTLIPGSYEDITFALYFQERFDEFFWTEVWSKIREDASLELLEAVQLEVQARGSNWIRTLTEAYLYHYASGSSRSTADFGFEESSAYPNPAITGTITDFSETFTDDFILAPISAYFFDFIPSPGLNGLPKVTLNSTLPTANLGVIGYFNDGSTRVTFAQSALDGVTELNTGWNVTELERMGIVVVNNSTSTLPSDRPVFSINVDSDIPQFVELLQNFPNPFNPSTNIRFRLNTTQNVELKVYDITGRLVQRLVNETLDAGDYTVQFNAQGLASGVYIYQLITPTTVTAEKMMLIK